MKLCISATWGRKGFVSKVVIASQPATLDDHQRLLHGLFELLRSEPRQARQNEQPVIVQAIYYDPPMPPYQGQ
jgi:hypothetical protein